jgi:NAD+ kinase
VTASKYPFPTVCADKQSTDWFHAISRTLKWNERERQKSFVVVEEGPQTSKKRRRRRSTTADGSKPLIKMTGPEVEGTLDDEEEDEVSDEDEKFDINDSSPEAALETPVPNRKEHTSTKDSPPAQTNRPRLRAKSGIRSAGETRSRLTGLHPHPPRTAIRHTDFGALLSPGYSDSSLDSAQHGARDDIHTSRAVLLSGKSRLPKDRADSEFDVINTPTTSDSRRGRKAPHTHASTSSVEHLPRAFAAWGQDESDSNASESESDPQG